MSDRAVLSQVSQAVDSEFTERAVVVVALAMILLFGFALMLLFVMSRLPRDKQLRFASRAAQIERILGLALDRYVSAFAFVIVLATFGLLALSIVILFVRAL